MENNTKNENKNMNIPSDREFLTYKAGKWVFSASCDEREIEPLLIRAETLLEAVSSIPMLPDWGARFNDELIRKSIFGTAAIEGNPLSEKEVSDALDKEPEQSSSRALREIANLKELYAELKTWKVSDHPLDEAMVRHFHGVICKDLAFADNIPGQYRMSNVVVGDDAHGGVYVPPRDRADIINLMRELFAWLTGEEVQQMSPLLRAACAHYYIARIHPFRDGNGRTARFAEAYILSRAGMTLLAPVMSNYYYSHIDDYFIAISQSEKSRNITPFFRFVLQGACASLEDIQKEVNKYITILLARDYIHTMNKVKVISDRQKNLLDIIMVHLHAITPEQLHEDPVLVPLYKGLSRMTARRDLKKLEELGILIRHGDSYVVNYNLFRHA